MKSARGTALPALIALLALLAAIAVLPARAGDAGGEPVASQSRLGGDGTQTRFVVEFDKVVPFRIFALADPYRVIVDLPQVTFALPDGAGREGAGLVSAYRYGLIAIGKSRIVLDTDKPVKIEEAHFLPHEPGTPARLVIDLAATNRNAFLAELKKDTTPLPPVRPEHVAAKPDDGLRKARSDDYVIVIDPGHGGIDSGAVGRGGVVEKELVLEFARALKADLEAAGPYKVLLTRNGDIFLPLRERVEFARRNNASLFVSVHADKFRGHSVRGATVYTLSEKASDAETAELAAKENKADVIAGLDLENEPDEVTDILISLAQRETKNLSVRFAKELVSTMHSAVNLNRNPHRFAGFRVLKAPDVPSVLIELGYLSNSSDVSQLSSADWRKRAASAVSKAVARFRENQFAGAR